MSKRKIVVVTTALLLAVSLIGSAPAAATSLSPSDGFGGPAESSGDAPAATQGSAPQSAPSGSWTLLSDDDDNASQSVDIDTVSVQSDSETLYFKYEFYGDIVNKSSYDAGVFIDTDQNVDTGLSTETDGWYYMSDIGADYAVVTGYEGPGVWKWNASGSYPSWEQTHSNVSYLDVDYANDEVVVGVSRADIGSPDEVDIVFANVDYADTMAKDYEPDRGEGHFTYSFDGAVTEPTPDPDVNTTVEVTLDGAPDGLQKYNVSVNATSGESISAVEAGVISGSQFQIVDGGVGNSSVTARGVDFGGSVGPTSDEQVLFTLTYDGEVSESDLSVSVETLTDDNSAEMADSRVGLNVEVESQNPFDSALAGGSNPPADLDGDGKFEDVNGDGQASFDDAITLAFVNSGSLTAEQVAALDFDGDGDVDFSDAISLAFSV
ncbi:MAG: hypothetical protein ACQETI_02460 [Halobacteriota archaeon]